jgi:hypothetical protein
VSWGGEHTEWAARQGAIPRDVCSWHFETSSDARYLAAFGGKADISQRLPNNRDL